MIEELKNCPYIDYEDVNGMSFLVTKFKNEYNLEFNFGLYSDDGEFEQGFTQRTSYYTEELPAMAIKILDIIDSGIYDHLIYLTESSCYDDSVGDVIFDFDWEDYFPSKGAIKNDL